MMKLSAALCLPAILVSSFAFAEVSLTFGVYTSDKPITMVKQFRPILSHIEKQLTEKLAEPVSIKIQVAKSYDAGMEDVLSGEVDFSRFGPVSYVFAKDKAPGIEILAMESVKGEKVFYGILAANKNSSIYNVSDVKGLRIAFGDDSSTIGRYLAQQYLVENGIYAKDLAGFEYLGRHDAVGEAVALSKFDAGFLKEGTFYKQVQKGLPLTEIARFPNVTKPWIASAGVSQRIKDALSEVLVEIDDPRFVSKGKFVKGTDADYAPIRDSINNNNAFFKGSEAE